MTRCVSIIRGGAPDQNPLVSRWPVVRSPRRVRVRPGPACFKPHSSKFYSSLGISYAEGLLYKGIMRIGSVSTWDSLTGVDP